MNTFCNVEEIDDVKMVNNKTWSEAYAECLRNDCKAMNRWNSSTNRASYYILTSNYTTMDSHNAFDCFTFGAT